MVTMTTAKRLIKRALLANIAVNKNDLFITPLLSGKHGIGKSQMIKSIASDLGGVCLTIEGGTLKEGEITGLPFQYVDYEGNTRFRFLPYYAIERIQQEEKRLFIESGREPHSDRMSGEENWYGQNDIQSSEKISLLEQGKIRLLIIFIDEINRTEKVVYKELMNILLTRNVNGYQLPWWVLFVAAMNPSTQNSIYSTNEMDPAQLDRFLKIKVKEDVDEWLIWGENHDIDKKILSFIKGNPNCLSVDDKELDDEEKPTPSPRGWDMIDSLIKSEPLVRKFFNEEENDSKIVQNDLQKMVMAKLGSTVSSMFFAISGTQEPNITVEDILNDTDRLMVTSAKISSLTSGKKAQLANLLLKHLIKHVDDVAENPERLLHLRQQVSCFLSLMDPSIRLLFGQNASHVKTTSGKDLLVLLGPALDDKTIGLLDIDETRLHLMRN